MNWTYLFTEGIKLLTDAISGLQLRLALQTPPVEDRQRTTRDRQTVELKLTYDKAAVGIVAARAISHAARIWAESSPADTGKKSESSKSARPEPSAPPPEFASDSPGTSANQDSPDASDDELCIICMASKVSVVLVPCGHLKYCGECAEQIRECSFCRQAIDRRVKVYR